LLAAVLGLWSTLQPGFWVGEVPDGRVWLVLRADGPATFGGVDYERWRIEGESLHLEGPQPLEVKVKSGPCLVGPPFGRVCLNRVAVAEPAPPPPRLHPPAWVGRWQHTASGGQLLLEVGADGHYQMTQVVVGDEAAVTAGTWHGGAEGLTLEPAGGPPLPYRARRVGPDLFISGGDLPLEVRFAPR
jgi:hypothetical protein